MMNNAANFCRTLIAVSFVLLPSVTIAEDVKIDAKKALYQCSDINSVLSRLDCFDKVIAELKVSEQSSASKAPVTLNQPVITPPATETVIGATKAANFGLPNIKIQKPKETENPDALKVVIIKYDRGLTPNIYMENGQVWKVDDAEDSTIYAKLPAKASIEKGGFGSYFLTIDGQRRNYRVSRQK